ncbi:hypothetical protein PInf_020178 [Phytophthora infestans]|nr:hypothetical protein PInf_020178 [Phytophthora infestans]
MTADVEEKSPPKGGMKQLVACRIEGHKIQKRLSPKKKALDPLRYLPDGGGYYALFTIAAYFETEGDETTERRHVVRRSYKHICTLHSRLLKTYPKSNLPKDLPSMRNKRYDNEYIEEKRNELTKYLAQLMQIPEVKASNVLRDFLEASTAAEDSSDDEDGPVAPLRMLEGLPGTIVTWFVLDPRKCVLRYYDSEAAARRGLSLAKLNLTNKHASLAITKALLEDLCAFAKRVQRVGNAISTAILTAQLSRRGRKSKKAMVKAAKNESDDETPKSDMATDTNGNNEVATMGSSRDPDRPLSPIEESDDDDDDSDNKDDGDSDDDDESESDSDDELHEGDDIEVVPPMTDIDSPINSQDEAVGSLPDLQNLPLEWKLGLVAVFNVALLSVRSAPVVVIVLVLFIINWYLLLKYMKATKDNEMDSSTAKPKAE